MIDLRDQLSPLIGNADGQVSQSELSRRSGVAQPDISRWLAGTRTLPLDRQIELAEALGFKVRIRLVRTPRLRAPA